MDARKMENVGINLNKFWMVKITISKNCAKQKIAKITLSKSKALESWIFLYLSDKIGDKYSWSPYYSDWQA